MAGLERRKDRHPPGSDIVKILKSCVWAETAAEGVVLLNIPSGTYLRLEGSAPAIVELLAEHGAARSTVVLAERYGISQERASADVAAVMASIEGLRSRQRSTPHRPTRAGSRTELRRWWSLPVRLRLDVARAFVAVVCVEVGLRTLDLERLARVVGVRRLPGGLHGRPLPAHDHEA